MPIAALPKYLGDDFRDASPGMRFGMYLKVWGVNRRTHALVWETHDIGYEVRGQHHQEREVRYENKVCALGDARYLSESDKRTMQAVCERQKHLYNAVAQTGASLCLEARATAPFTTGLGNEHPLENGFAFLNPFGLPYLPGSGVKGVLRQAARELASGEWGEAHGWSSDKTYTLMEGEGAKRRSVLDARKQPVKLSTLDVLFGRESQDGDKHHVRGALTFWDVIPQIKGDSLMVEIMTPHQGHYYQWKKDRHGNEIEVSPHESGQPNPISFLTVPPGSAFAFYVLCDRSRLARLAPDLDQGSRWKVLLEAAFSHAFAWLGFGAKTAVGYGAMTMGATASPAMDPREKPGLVAKPAGLPAPAVEHWAGVRLLYSPNNGALTVDHPGQQAQAVGPKAAGLIASLPTELQARLKTRKELKGCEVDVEKVGNRWQLVAIIPPAT